MKNLFFIGLFLLSFTNVNSRPIRADFYWEAKTKSWFSSTCVDGGGICISVYKIDKNLQSTIDIKDDFSIDVKIHKSSVNDEVFKKYFTDDKVVFNDDQIISLEVSKASLEKDDKVTIKKGEYIYKIESDFIYFTLNWY